MKALTVCQPYAYLLLSKYPDGRLVKPIENRPWSTSYRGPLVIHAGKSTDWMLPGDEERYPHLIFGAVVGVVDVVDCRHVDDLPVELQFHEHAEGPWCWIIENPRHVIPVPIRGALGLWNYQGRLEYLAMPGEDAVALLSRRVH